jgi:hypothetical protein
MRGLNKLIIPLLIFVIICNETHLSFALTHDSEEGEPFNIGQQLITHKDARLVQNQLYYFQYDKGSITVDRMRFAYGFSTVYASSVAWNLRSCWILNLEKKFLIQENL